MSPDVPDPLEVRIEPAPGGVHRVVAVGEIDLSTVPDVRAAVRRAARHAVEVHLDLRGVTFLDSAGVSLLLGVDAASRADGFGFAIVASEAVVEVLRLCGVEERLPLRQP